MDVDHVGPRSWRRLLEAAVAISSDLELRVVLRRVVEAAVELVGARYGALGVLDENRNRLTEFITVGFDEPTRAGIGAPPKGLGLLGSLIRTAEPLRCADLREHPDSVGFPDGHPPMTSFLGVPIRVRDEVYGNLYLTDKVDGGEFSDIDQHLAVGLASAAAVTIDNARLFDEVRRRSAVEAAMNEVATALLGGVDPTDSLHLVARRARELVDADLATVALPRPDDTLVIEVVDGTAAGELAGRSFPRTGSISGEVLRSGVMVVLEDASRDHRLAQPQVLSGRIGPAVWVPLTSGGTPFGTLSVTRRVGAAPFRTAEVDVVRSFATQASVILERDRDRQRLTRLARLEDQERIARDLHDDVIQRLFATGMSLQSVAALAPDDRARGRIAAAVDELDVTIRQIRTVIFGLGATMAGPVSGLRHRVLEVSAEAARVLGFEPQVRFDGPIDTLAGPTVAAEAVVTLREALSNVARHAGARRVDVAVAAGRDLVVVVDDDGVGLDPAGAGPGGRGLANMAARAERLGGRLELEPAPLGGTRVRWSVPFGD